MKREMNEVDNQGNAVEPVPGHKLSRVLARLMAANRLDAPELSLQTGIPVPTINRLRSNMSSNPTISSLMPIANYFKVTLNQLIGEDPLPGDKLAGLFNPNAFTVSHVPLVTMKDVLEPGKLAKARNESENFKWLATSSQVTADAFAIEFSGLALAPQFVDGTIFILEPKLAPSDKDIVLVRLSGQETPVFRQILLDGDDLYFRPINPEFGKMVLDREATLFGVMIVAISEFKK